MQPEQNRRMGLAAILMHDPLPALLGLAVVLIGDPFRRLFFSKAISANPAIAVTETTLS